MKNKKELTNALMMYAVNLLARRRYSVSKLQQKLFEKCKKINRRENITEEITGDQQEAAQDVIDFLLSKKYLNDNEYAELYVLSELRRKPSGKFVIKHKLQQKGISSNIINSTLSSYTPQDEFEQAKDALKKKLITLRENDPQKKQVKLTRFLASRGFPFSVIQSVLKEIVNQELEEQSE
jgi:regulatory protein